MAASVRHELIIRRGLIADGGGGEPFVADLAISADRIDAIAPKLRGAGVEEIDACGSVVTPGFIDVHTHYDGQVTWENTLSPSSGHGVSTVVMGNCGVGFAPCKADQRDMLLKLMEGVEDIPEPVMAAGVPWNWTTFPDYLDALDARSFDVNIAAQLPHSPLRVFVMGRRGAEREPPTADDLVAMQKLTAEAVGAGALGVTTSRSLSHRAKSGALAPSVQTEMQELLALARGLKDAGAGVFQAIPEMNAPAADEFAVFRRIAETSGRPLSFTLMQIPRNENAWRDYLQQLEAANRDGLEIRGQVYPRATGGLYGLDLSLTPFFLNPSYRAIADLPLAEKLQRLRDPALRAQILSERPVSDNPLLMMQATRNASLYALGDTLNYEPSLSSSFGALAAAQGISVNELAYDKMLERDGRALFFATAANYVDGNLDAVHTMLRSPHTMIGLGDGGAHYGFICDAAYTTYFLMRWVRDAKPAQAVPLGAAIRMLTATPARAMRLAQRGVLQPGAIADVNIIDLEKLALGPPTPVRDLPAGGRRLAQSASGYVASIVNGVITRRNGAATGALPGRLVRGEGYRH